jgi:hypothetical protein
VLPDAVCASPNLASHSKLCPAATRAVENGLPQAFGRWFAEMYFDKPQNFSISDGRGDGKVDLFFQTTMARKSTIVF